MIQSVDRAVDILLALRSAPPDGLFTMEISRVTNLNKAVCYNILKTLKSRGVVEQSSNGGRYTLSRSFFSFSGEHFDDAFLCEHLAPMLRQISRSICETVSLAALRGDLELKILLRERYDHEIIFSPNRHKPFYSTASGRCLLASLSDKDVECLVRRDGLPEPNIWQEAADVSSLKKELAKIRKNGRVQIISSERHVAAFGYMVKNSESFSPLALGFAMPLYRYEKGMAGDISEKFFSACGAVDESLYKLIKK